MTVTKQVIAFDPGASCGYARIDATLSTGARSPVVTLVEWGVVRDPGAKDIDAILLGYRPDAVVAIEKIVGGGYSHASKGAAQVGASLVETNFQAGLIAGIASRRERDVFLVPATAWRSILTGRPGASDGHISVALGELTVGGLLWGMPPRSNAHNRDALGCAIAAAYVALGLVPQPPSKFVPRAKKKKAVAP